MFRLYNTLTRTQEPITPLDSPKIKLYTCGPTVYNYAHLGNLRYYTFTDVLRRTLVAQGYDVEHVMNITDVGHLTSDADEGEDKLEKGALREKKTVWEVAQFYTDAFLADAAKLNIRKADQLIPATSQISKQQEMIQLLVDKGYTYQTKHAIYFDTAKLADYGKLTGQKIADKRSSREGVVVDPEKRRQADFALWFFTVGHYKDHAMRWDSPWGDGFPGWHIECSAINWAAFPDGTDIHTGGIDHIAVHHTNEIAQYEAALGRPMATYWLHSNFLVLKDAQKMAKSGENFVTLQSVLDRGIDPLAYRYFAISAHYRSELLFSWEAVEAAAQTLKNLQAIIREWEKPGIGCAGFEQEFMAALQDDLNTPKALSVLWEMVKSGYPTSAKAASLLVMDEIIGLNLASAIHTSVELPAAVKQLAQEREQARLAKDFAKSDELRQQIKDQGYAVQDSADGQKIVQK